MTDRPESEKPKTVAYAECAFLAWTAWTCLFGFFQTWGQIPDLEQALSELQGLIVLSPRSILAGAAAGYGLLAIVSAWIIVKIGAGRHWARSSALWGFIFQVALMALPPYHKPAAADYLEAIPDLGLQIYALYLLYTPPGAAWFTSKTRVG